MEKVLIIGGSNSGKTSLVARILNLSYQKLLEAMNGLIGVNIHTFSNYSFWDVSGSCLTMTRSVHDYIFYSTSGILLVADSSSPEGSNDVLKWIALIRNYISTDQIPIFVLANKADSMKHVTTQFFDKIVSRFLFSGWYWTVGHAQYGDYDFRRGRQSKQLSINEVVTKLEKLIIEQSHNEQLLESVFDSMKPLFPSPVEELLDVESTDAHSNDSPLPTPTGWEYYGGVMTRDEAEKYLDSCSVGKFLLRRSDVTFQLRVAIILGDRSIGHILLKQKQRNQQQQQQERLHEEQDVTEEEVSTLQKTTFISIGKKELKGIVFNDLADALFRGLNLIPQDGIKFRRVVSHKGAQYLPIPGLVEGTL